MLLNLSIPRIHLLLKKGEIRVETLLDEVYKRIEKSPLNTFITLSKERSYKRAREIQKKIEKGEMDLLTGIPIAVKDNICLKGEGVTCASGMLQNFISPYSATVIERIEKRGAIIIGKTNLDEFAMGSSTETSFYGPAKNPINEEYVPGGSSGGSAAAVANFEAVAALGSDTGGSIRQPASFCGVFGLRPTYGRVSRYGLVAFASSLDSIGPITHNVVDSAIMLEVIAGYDPNDSTSLPLPVPEYSRLLGRKKGVSVGIVKGELFGLLDAEIIGVMDEFALGLRSAGLKVKDIELTGFDICIPVYYIIATAEVSSNLARYDGVRYGHKISNFTSNFKDMYTETRAEGFGKEVKRRIMLGTFCLRAGYKEKYYRKATMAREKIKELFKEALEEVDALILPTSPTLPFKIGEKISDPIGMYLSDLCTVSASLAGLPAISVPAGYRKGFAVGMQIVGRKLEEETILRIAHLTEKNGLAKAK